MATRPSSVPLQVPLPSPPPSFVPDVPDPESDLARAASPTVPRLLATVVTGPSFESAAAFGLVVELVDFVAACRLDYATRLSLSLTLLRLPGTTLAALGFAPSSADPLLFLRIDTSLPPFYALVCVDDLVFATADTKALALVKSELQKRHTCTDLGVLHSYLGLQITRDRAWHTITLTQSHMVHQVLQRFDFRYSSPQSTLLPTSHSLSAPPSDESVEPSGPYPELVGCLMYLMTCSRPDLAYPLSILARYVAPGRHQPEHWEAAKNVLCYLCSTLGMGFVLGGRGLVVLTGHADASLVDDLATQRSSQGYTFSLGSGSVSWRSTHSSSVLSSSCEAEIYVGAMAAQELRWLAYLLTDLGERPRSSPVLYVNNKAMIALCQEHRLEHRTKHIALRYFLARELQQRGQLPLAYAATRANTADIHQGTSVCTTQELKLYHGKGGLYIGKAVLKNNVFVLDFVPDLGTADSDGIVTFTSWTHPLDLDPDFSSEGFWYSHTISEAERTRALATIQHSAAAEPTPAAAATTSAAAETTSAAAETTAAAAATSTPIAGPSTALAPIDDTPPTPAQQLNPTPREVHRSANFTASFYSKGIKRLISLPYAHQQQGVAERMNRTLQNTMRKLLRGIRLPNHQWPEAMDHAVMLHNLLSSSSLPNNASPHLLWRGKQGSTKMLRFFGCMVLYRPPSARAGRFSQRAQWGLHLGIERNYNAWKFFNIHSKETVAARDVIFYERLTLSTYLANLAEDRDPTGGFRGDRAFALTAEEAD
ncbi:unnamed protein product [Closterium sp. NIES-54]